MSKDRFSAVKSIGRNEIITQPERFQGRQGDFSDATVKAIVSKGYYDNSRDPIIVWFDAVADKYVVMAGHSRLEAWDQLAKSNSDMKEIPVIAFKGDMEDAIDFAIIESNRGSTEEGLKSDLEAYTRAVTRGKSRKYLLGMFKPKSRLDRLQKLSNLNPKGRFIEMLSGDAALSFPYLERNAMWVGDMRSSLPSLSDSHELELFKFIYDTGKGLKLKKQQLYKVVEDRVGRIDFNPAEPLNLENRVSTSVYTDPIIEQIALVNKEIERADKEIKAKREILVTAKKDKIAPKITDPIFKKIDDLNRYILRKIQEREDLKQKAGKVERTMTADLFSIAPEPVKKDDNKWFDEAKKVALELRGAYVFKSPYHKSKKMLPFNILGTVGFDKKFPIEVYTVEYKGYTPRYFTSGYSERTLRDFIRSGKMKLRHEQDKPDKTKRLRLAQAKAKALKLKFKF